MTPHIKIIRLKYPLKYILTPLVNPFFIFEFSIYNFCFTRGHFCSFLYFFVHFYTFLFILIHQINKNTLLTPLVNPFFIFEFSISNFCFTNEVGVERSEMTRHLFCSLLFIFVHFLYFFCLFLTF